MSYSLFQTIQTGGQWYSDTSPFSISWLQVNPGKPFHPVACYGHITIVNDDSSVDSMSSLIDDARGAIYNCIMFIIQATGVMLSFLEP